MEVLISPTETFNLNQPTSKLIDQKMCVYDCSDKNYQDFYFKRISTFISYRYPTATLLIDKKYTLELPLNWKLMVTNDNEYVCRMVAIEDILHLDSNQVPLFNPFHPGVSNLPHVEIKSLNPNPVEHFVPKIPKRCVLALPITNNNCYTCIEDKKGNIVEKYVRCVYAMDDLDTSKIEVNYWDMIDG